MTLMDEHTTNSSWLARLAPGPVVIKLGGGDLDATHLYQDLAILQEAGIPFVLVHGGNAALTRLQTRLGQPPVFVESQSGGVSRYTDLDTIEAMAMAYAGQANVAHVCALRARGVNALGLTGVDGGLLTGTRRPVLRGRVDGKRMILRDDHVGSIDSVNVALLESLLTQGYAPVVTVPAYADGPEGDGGVPINVDGDSAAQAIAQALRARALVYLSDVPGLLANVDDPTSIMSVVHDEAAWTQATAAGRGRFRRKIEGARAAVLAGIGCVVIASANQTNPLAAALGGAGTTFLSPEAPPLEVPA